MDREKALQYFRQLGFNSPVPLSARGHPRLKIPPEIVVEGDGFRSRHLGHRKTEGPSTEETPADAWIEYQSLLPMTTRQAGKSKQGEGGSNSWAPVTINTTCYCSRQVRSAQASLAAGGDGAKACRHDSDDDDIVSDDSDDNSEEEGLTLDKLLTLMVRLQKRGESSLSSSSSLKNSSSTLARLVASFTPPADPLDDRSVHKLLSFLESRHSGVREVCLRLVQRLLARGGGVTLVTKASLVHTVINLATDPSHPAPIRVNAMGVLDKMLNLTELDYPQIQPRLDREVYPRLLQVLQGKGPLDVKYAACCVLRSLARHADFAVRIKKESLFLLKQLRDASARLKEVYVGVLMALFAHPGLTEAGSVDTGVVPVLKAMLRDGPCDTQRQALELLQCVVTDDRGVDSVTCDHRMVAYVLACLLTSLCRKVRTQACVVLTCLTSLHTAGKVRPLMEAIGHYVGCSMEGGAASHAPVMAGAKITYPVTARHQAEIVTWHQLDIFLQAVAGLWAAEGLVSMEGDSLQCELPVRGEVSQTQLSCLTHLLLLMVNVCVWPLQRRVVGHGNTPPPRLDLTHLTDDPALRQKFGTLNQRMAVQQWQRFGPSVFAVLRWMSQRIAAHLRHPHCARPRGSDVGAKPSRPASSAPSDKASATTPAGSALSGSSFSTKSWLPSSASSARGGGVWARYLLTDAEWRLTHGLLSLVLCVTLATCRQIADPLAAHQAATDNAAPPPPGASVRKGAEPSGLWVKANPHLTHSGGRGAPSLEEVGERQREAVEREGLSDRRRVRREVVNEGLFPFLAPFLRLPDPEIKMLCCLILRTVVQPLDEKPPAAMTSQAGEMSSYHAFGHSSQTSPPLHPRRPQSAMVASSSRRKEKQLHWAFSHMSPTSLDVIKDALGPQPSLACRGTPEKALTSARRPMSAMGATWIHQGGGALGAFTPYSNRNASSASYPSPYNLHPLLPGQPINRACQREAVMACGSEVITSLFCRSRGVKLYCLSFLYDLVRLTAAPLHMELSKCGIVPKLLDFIRVNEDDDHLEILALRVLSLLMVSDVRLTQLFSHHGGHMVLTAMMPHATDALREQVKATLATVTKGQRFDSQGQVIGQRPSSGPLSRRGSCPATVSGPPRDIWEHIMQRWAQEDKVVEVLQKFMHNNPTANQHAA